MDLSIIVVSYNTRRLLEDCLMSVERHLEGRLDYELVVVDNASTDGSPEWLETIAATRPRLRVVRSPRNLGFSGGNNLGLDVARGRNILLLNSDASLVDDSVVEAVRHLESDPRIFSVTCMLLDGDGRPGPSYGHFPSPSTVARELATKRYGQLRAVSPPEHAPTRAVDFPCGAYFLMKSSLLREIGRLDEGFFMYFEEADLAKRAVDLGYRNVYFAPAKAVHLGGKSSGEGELRSYPLTRLFYSSWRRYLVKHHSRLGAFAVRAMLGSYFALAWRSHFLRGNRTVADFFRTHGRALAEGWGRDSSKPPTD